MDLNINLKLAICLPSNKPKLAIETFAPSFEYIKELAPYAVFCINYQPPWTLEEISIFSKIIMSYGFEVRSIYTSNWTKPIEFIKMREMAAELMSEADVYMLCDDDFRFVECTESYPRSSGQRYLEVLDYLSKNPRCGGVTCKHMLGGYHQQYKILPIWDNKYCTNRGMFLRRISNKWCIAPPHCHTIRGALEESIACFTRMEMGYWFGKQMNNPFPF